MSEKINMFILQEFQTTCEIVVMFCRNITNCTDFYGSRGTETPAWVLDFFNFLILLNVLRPLFCALTLG